MNYAAVLFMRFDGELESNATKYSLNSNNDLAYDNKRLGMHCRWIVAKKLHINPSVSYYYNAQLPKEFQRSQTLLNAGVNYFLLKNNKLSVGVTVNDILNNGVTTTRTVTATAIETTQVNVIRRYAMFTVRYRPSQFGGVNISE
jgi:hypothetical protein